MPAFGANASLLDNFNRGDVNPLAGNWPNANSGGSPNLGIVSNVVACDSTNTGVVYWSPTTFGPNVDAYITMTTLAGAANGFRVLARGKDFPGTATWDGYEVRTAEVAGASNDQVMIERVDNGTPTTLGAAITQEITAGDKLGIRCVGSSISAYLFTGGAWNLLGTRTDATYAAAGNIGFGIRGLAGRADDAFAGTVAPDSSGGVLDSDSWSWFT